jgi:hypothetical protein
MAICFMTTQYLDWTSNEWSDDELDRIWKEGGRLLIKVLSWNLFQGLRKTQKKTCQDSQCLSQDLNQSLPEYQERYHYIKPLVSNPCPPVSMSPFFSPFYPENGDSRFLKNADTCLLITKCRILVQLESTVTWYVHSTHSIQWSSPCSFSFTTISCFSSTVAYELFHCGHNDHALHPKPIIFIVLKI